MIRVRSGFPEKLYSSSEYSFRLRDDRLAVHIGFTLAAFVFALAACHVVGFQIRGNSENPGFYAIRFFSLVSLESEGSFSETFNRGMLFACALLFLSTSYELRARTPFFLSVFFGFALLDDSSQYHEGVGRLISETLQIPSAFGLEGQDFGELLAWGLAGVLLLPLAIWAYSGRRQGDGTVLRMLAVPIGGLLFCAVVLDIVHVIVKSPDLEMILVILEDGGEMLAIAGAVAVSLAVMRNSREIYDLPARWR